MKELSAKSISGWKLNMRFLRTVAVNPLVLILIPFNKTQYKQYSFFNSKQCTNWVNQWKREEHLNCPWASFCLASDRWVGRASVRFAHIYFILNYITLHRTIQWICGQLKTEYEILLNKPHYTSQIVTCIITNKGNFNFSQHFIICVGLCTVLPNICLAEYISVFLGNGTKPSQRHLPPKLRATSLLTCASTKSMVYSSFSSNPLRSQWSPWLLWKAS